MIDLTLVAEESGEYKVDIDAKAKKEGEALLKSFTKEMQMNSRALEFERASQLRDMIFELQDTMGIKR